MTKNFDTITAEAEFEHGVMFYERTDHTGQINGYSVVRTSDGLTASMLHTEGRTWRGAFGKDRTQGTKAVVADWALDKVANADYF